MKIINTIPFESQKIIHCYPDDYSFTIVFNANNAIGIANLESDSLKMINHFQFEIELNKYFDACIDDSCIYLPTTLGQIVAIDKFSGEILNTINTSMPIMSNISQNKEYVCCVCGIPLNRKHALVTDKFSACLFDKISGKKALQTSYFGGEKFYTQTFGNNVFVSTSNYILKYSKEGLIGSSSIAHAPDYAPIVTENHIFLLSSSGTMRVLNTTDLSLSFLYKIEPSISKPMIWGNQAFWLSKNGICSINQETKEHNFKNLDISINLGSAIDLNKGGLYFGDNQGRLVCFDVQSNETSFVKLSDHSLGNFTYCNGHVLVTSLNQIHLIET